MILAIKLSGAVFLTAAAAMVGWSIADGLKRRIEALSWYLRSMSLISDRIRYSSAELKKIIEGLPSYENYLKVCCPLKVTAQNSALKSDDIFLLDEFFSRLGMGDTTEQINLCSMYAKELETRYSDAEKEYKEKSRPIKSLGFFTGLGIAIILI